MMQDHITAELIGIFHLLKKHNYVEICLSVIETEYHKINYSELELIRINTVVRYQNGDSNKFNPFILNFIDKVIEDING